ncbi:MAG: DnaJ domain protein [Gammaproteobacteria bacterium]|nr:DnaJ domain protein [Gammaproteobacteria bacterium]
MTAPLEAFPLTWPVNRPRTQWTQTSRFRTTLGAAIKEVQAEVERLGGSSLIISSNLPLRRDGMPYANSAQPGDRGVAVYFTYKKRPMCFACDRWGKVEENMWAIAKTIDALRGIERWGSGQMVEQAFTGFVALPAPEQPWQTLGLSTSRPTREQIDEAHRRLAAQHHPDRPGGDTHEMARINAARDELYRDLL